MKQNRPGVRDYGGIKTTIHSSKDNKEETIRNDVGDDREPDDSSVYEIQFGKRIWRTGKVFSFTFWRIEVGGGEVFWCVQGNDTSTTGDVWIVTKYFGKMCNSSTSHNRRAGERYQQEVILHHPADKCIKLYYASLCGDDTNCIRIPKQIVQHFKDRNNSFKFEYRVLKLKKIQ